MHDETANMAGMTDDDIFLPSLYTSAMQLWEKTAGVFTQPACSLPILHGGILSSFPKNPQQPAPTTSSTCVHAVPLLAGRRRKTKRHVCLN